MLFKNAAQVSKTYMNNFTLFFISASTFASPVGLSKAPCLPHFSQAITYFLAFQIFSGGPLMLSIIKSLTRSTASLFFKLVWWRFIWLNPLSHLPKVWPAPRRGREANTGSRGMLVKAMPSVMKASAEVSPRALREVDRLNENPERPGGQRRQWTFQHYNVFGPSHGLNGTHVMIWQYVYK